MIEDIDLKAYIKDYVEPTAEERAVWEAEKRKHVQQAQDRYHRIFARMQQVGGDKFTELADNPDYHVSYHFSYDETVIDIIGDGRAVSLAPEHALSLLAWLRQEEATLEQLAKEIEL